jgi:SOS-response transcriptional repressor LexA
VDGSFTKLQGQYLAFIALYTKLHRRPPAEADIQAYFGVTPPAVHNMIVTLGRLGLISRSPGQPRSIRVLVAPELLPPLACSATRRARAVAVGRSVALGGHAV